MSNHYKRDRTGSRRTSVLPLGRSIWVGVCEEFHGFLRRRVHTSCGRASAPLPALPLYVDPSPSFSPSPACPTCHLEPIQPPQRRNRCPVWFRKPPFVWWTGRPPDHPHCFNLVQACFQFPGKWHPSILRLFRLRVSNSPCTDVSLQSLTFTPDFPPRFLSSSRPVPGSPTRPTCTPNVACEAAQPIGKPF